MYEDILFLVGKLFLTFTLAAIAIFNQPEQRKRLLLSVLAFVVLSSGLDLWENQRDRKAESDLKEQLTGQTQAHNKTQAMLGDERKASESLKKQLDEQHAMLKDEKKTSEALKKEIQEQHAILKQSVPASPPLPDITLTTLPGVTAHPPDPNSRDWSADDDSKIYREHVLTVTNRSDIPIFNFATDIQFPEWVVEKPKKIEKPAQSNVTWSPKIVDDMVFVGARIQKLGNGPKVSPNFHFEIGQLLKGDVVKVQFWTMPSDMPDVEALTKKPQDCLRFFLRGDFKYSWYNVHRDSKLIVPIKFDSAARHLSMTEPEIDDGKRCTRRSMFWHASHM